LLHWSVPYVKVCGRMWDVLLWLSYATH